LGGGKSGQRPAVAEARVAFVLKIVGGLIAGSGSASLSGGFVYGPLLSGICQTTHGF
jgi:hypothetical protein